MPTDPQQELRRKLLATFHEELDEYVDVFTRGLLAIEQAETGGHADVLTELVRVAHSMKGAARAVGVRDIEALAHGLEDVLVRLQQGTGPAPQELLAPCFMALDVLRVAVAENRRGEAATSNERIRGVLTELEAACRATPPPERAKRAGSRARRRAGGSMKQVTTPRDPRPGANAAAPVPVVPDGADGGGLGGPSRPPKPRPGADRKGGSGLASPAVPASARHGTIRVATGRVDVLMAGIGELVAARMRTVKCLDDVSALEQRLFTWRRAWHRLRPALRHLRRRGPVAPELRALLEFMALNDGELSHVSDRLGTLGRTVGGEARTLGSLTDALRDSVYQLRLVPIAALFEPFPRMIRDLAQAQAKDVVLRIEGEEVELDRPVLESLKAPVTHLLRNAVDHGIEKPVDRDAKGKPRRGTVLVRATHKEKELVLEIADDGAGMDVDSLKQRAVDRGLLSPERASALSRSESLDLAFRSGLSTADRVTDVSGRGVGLDVVRESVDRLRGHVTVDSALGRGTTFTLTVPVTMGTSHVLLVEAGGLRIGVPTHAVIRILGVSPQRVRRIGDQPVIDVDGQATKLLPLADLLDRSGPGPPVQGEQSRPVIVMGIAERRAAFLADAVHGTEQVILKPLGPRLKRVRNVTGGAILGSGHILILVNPADLMRSAHHERLPTSMLEVREPQPTRRRVLVVDDSITTRTLERNILESAGYQVLIARDGREAWALLQTEAVDAVVSDIDMPNMDGCALTRTIRRSDRHESLPVVLVTSLESSEDKARGMEAGADAYITKGAFDQTDLLDVLERLLG